MSRTPEGLGSICHTTAFRISQTPQESNGFSPFKLFYGCTVCGPIAILKELWTGQTHKAETKTTYQYIADLQERLECTCELACQELNGQSQNRKLTTTRTPDRSRTYEVGDKVLLLIPTDHNKILMQWKGPFKIKEKLNSMNFRIDLGHRSQTYHANLLKKYHCRPEAAASCLQWDDHQQTVFELSAISVIEEDDADMEIGGQPHFSIDEMHLPPMVAKESIRDVSVSPNLVKTQQIQAKHILGNFKSTLTVYLHEHIWESIQLSPPIKLQFVVILILFLTHSERKLNKTYRTC